MNTYQDSTDVLSALIFDPLESYYYLPIDQKTHCFVNIFLDLCEIERQKLTAQISKAKPFEIPTLYRKFEEELQEKKAFWLKELQRGENQAGMIKWNEIIKADLGIDNIAHFDPYSKEEK